MAGGIAMFLLVNRHFVAATQFGEEMLGQVKALPLTELAAHRDTYLSAASYAYYALLGSAAAQWGEDSVKAVMGRMRSDAARFGFKGQVLGPLTALDTLFAMYGKPAPMLTGTRWYGTSNTARPSVGKVSLLLFHAERSTMPMLRRFKARYGDDLEITIVDATRGYFMTAGPLSPKEEADTLAYFYRTVLGAPAAVLVNESPTQRIPEPDGRIKRGATANVRAYHGAAMAIIDRAQRVRYLAPGSMVLNEARLVDVLDQAMRATPE
jgi:hypothetical protein